MRSILSRALSVLFLPVFLGAALPAAAATAATPVWRKTEDITIYSDPRFHTAFPSAVKRPDGELIVAFRRAPDRRRVGETKVWHADPNSQPVLVRSRDDGKTWSQPEVVYAHPFGGSQDPCMLQLRDGTLLLTSYAWAWMSPETIGKLKQPTSVNLGKFVFLGGYIVRSTNGGKSWEPPVLPPVIPTEAALDIFGEKVPAYNRGALAEGKSGRIFWVGASNRQMSPHRWDTHLLTSDDKGTSWNYSGVIASDEKVSFNETSIYETPRGDLVAFLRTAGLDDHLAIARSTDGGKSFAKWQKIGFKGHPFHALRLPDDRVLLVYGYRHQPYGIRARILNAECTDAETAAEIVLRTDGGNFDLGYPWSVLLNDRRVLVTYYFNRADGARTIEGTILEAN
ncbi:MAG: sialidase family protein [Verrucomicrobiota bacterium]